MKNTLLLISRYFSSFLAIVFIFSLLSLSVMLTVPVHLFAGNLSGRNFTDNFGGMAVNFLENDYLHFLFFPLLPFIGAFFLLSVFIRIYYRHDKEAGRIGFQNIILTILTAFALGFLPVEASWLGYGIQEQRDKIVNEIFDDGAVYVNKGISKEFLKLYQTLADEGIESWRKDPIAVVQNELEKGDLTPLSRGLNSLTLESIDTDSSNKITTAVVLLVNERLKAEIRLNRYWESSDGVWIVKSYKPLAD